MQSKTRLPMSHSIPFSKAFALLLAAAFLAVAPAAAQDLVYRPKNPAFGGSPLNYQWMLNSAQVQNPYDGGGGADPFARDPLADFQTGLQRQILGELSRELVRNRFGENLDLTEEGRYDLGDFTIEIVPGLDGVNIRIVNVLTGDESTVTIPTF